MNPTAQQLLQIRTQPHATVLWLSIYRPKILLQAQVSGTFVQGENQINFDNIVTGSYLNCYPNITVKIGTSQGGSEVGTIRLRMITGSYAVFAENSIVWQNDFYLTFIDYIDVNPVFPRIIQDPSQEDNVIFYKDDDIAYSNQNSVYGTFPCAGPHRAAFLETGTVSIFYSSTGSYNVRGDSLTYDWAFEGGTPTGSTAATPGNIAYTTPGHYRTRLIITSSSGAQDVTYRYVSIYDRPENGTSPPVLRWEMGDLTESRGEGGCIVHMKSFDNLADIEPNALVVIFQDNWFGGTKISIGGNAINNPSIFFVGYILKDSITFNYSEGYAEYDVGSVTVLMKETEGFSVSCESVVTASTWFQLVDMNVTKAMYHYLRWHSTVLNVADFQYTADDRLVQYFDSDRASLFDAIDTFVREGLIAEVVSDRQGKIWVEISPPGYQNPMTRIDTGMTLQKQDWMGEPNITHRRTAGQSFVELGGVVYQGPQTNQFQALLSNAPSITPLYRGKSESPLQGLITVSQIHLNQVAGNYLADKNEKFPVVNISLAGNYQVLNVAPQEKIFLDINAQDTKVGESLIGRPYRISSMTWRYDNTEGTLTPDIEFSHIVTGTTGQTLLIPLIPPEVGGGYSFPPLNLPPLPTFPIPPVEEQISRDVLFLDANVGFVYTLDFDAAMPTYGINNAGLDTGINATLYTFFIAPNGSVWVAYHGLNEAAVYYAPSVDARYTKVIDQAFLEAQYPASADHMIQSIGFNPEEPEEIAVVMGGTSSFDSHDGNLWIGNRSGFTRKVSIPNINMASSVNNRGNTLYDTEANKWIVCGSIELGLSDRSGLVRINDAGTSIELVKSFTYGNQTFPSIIARDSGEIYMFKAGDGTDLEYTPDGGTTCTLIVEDLRCDAFYPFYNHAVDPTGQFLMGVWSTGLKGKSGDYGTTWTGLPTLPPGNEYCFAYCGGVGLSSQWIAARGVVRYSPDFGNTWLNKEGNIANVLLPFITDIRGVAVNVGRRTV